MSSKKFYKNLPYLDQLEQITNTELYREIPPDWHIMLSDVKDSTIEIEEGKYREVNFIAACCVMGIINLDRYNEFPFVFGGDGATIVVHPDYLEQAKDVMRDTQHFAMMHFGIDIRVGSVPVIDVLRQRYAIKISKVKVSDNFFQSVFIGGGVEHAEDLLKSEDKYLIKYQPPKFKANFVGLECLWQNIPANSDEAISLLIKATSQTKSHKNIYKQIFQKINEIYGDKEERFPVDKNKIRASFNLQKLKMESRLESYQFGVNYRRTLFRKIMQAIRIKIGSGLRGSVGRLMSRIYQQTAIQSIDSEKFDDMLRMVISGNEEQRLALIEFLEDKYQNGEIVYGTHVASSVYLTCLILARKGRHVHFIDGSNGGYAFAAKEFKNKMKLQKIYMKAF